MEIFSRVWAETWGSRPSPYPLFPEFPPRSPIPVVGILAGLVVVVSLVLWGLELSCGGRRAQVGKGSTLSFLVQVKVCSALFTGSTVCTQVRLHHGAHCHITV